jgi:Guanylate-binding protein, N-terminal domain
MQMFGLRGGASRASSTSNPNNGSGNASSSSHFNSNSTKCMGPSRPLKLVYTDESGKFRMDEEAVAALQLVKGPIGVVSVCGRARQGKSFILNQVHTFLWKL